MRIRSRLVQCRRAYCTKCPHGPYYWAVWSEGGRRIEQYYGKTQPPLTTIPFLNLFHETPTPGTTLRIPGDSGVVWGTAERAHVTWYSLPTIVRVDAHGVSRMGSDHALTSWVTIRAQDGRRVYRQERLRARVAVDWVNGGGSDPEEDGATPWEMRWPLRLLERSRSSE